MRQQLTLAIVLTLAVTPAFGQRAGDMMGGDLPQQYGNNINDKLEHRMVVDAMLADRTELEQYYSPEQVAAFFEQAVVKVTFYAGGTYVAYARQGGDVVELALGRTKIELGERTWRSGDWQLRAGEYAVPKRSQPVSLGLAVHGNRVAVECVNRYEQGDETVTFYVGPMNGLLCIGFLDAEAAPFDEVTRTADSTAGAVAAPGS